MMHISLNKDAIAFDLDGTLIDISKRDFIVYSNILLEMGFVPMPFDVYWKKRAIKTPITQILSKSAIIGKSDIDLFLSKRNDYIDSEKYLKIDQLFDNTIFVLTELSKRYNLFLVTSRCRVNETLLQIKKLGISEFFCEVFIVNGDKLKTLESINNLVAMIGDTENDIIPANHLNISSIALTSGIRDKAFLIKLSPTYLFDDISNVLDVFIK